MKAEDLMNCMTEISDKHIAEFAFVKEKNADKRKRKNFFSMLTKRKICVIAAACAVMVIAAVCIFIVGNQTRPDVRIPQNSTSVAPAEKSVEESEKTEAVLTVKYYSGKDNKSGKYVDMVPDEPIKIEGNYNTSSDSDRESGIPFEIVYPGKKINLETNNGHFMTWNNGEEKISDYGNEFSGEDRLEIFWTPYSEDIMLNKTADLKISIEDSNGVVVLSLIKISSDDGGKTFSAKLQRYEEFTESSAEKPNENQIINFYREPLEYDGIMTVKAYYYDDENKKHYIDLKPGGSNKVKLGYIDDIAFEVEYPDKMVWVESNDRVVGEIDPETYPAGPHGVCYDLFFGNEEKAMFYVNFMVAEVSEIELKIRVEDGEKTFMLALIKLKYDYGSDSCIITLEGYEEYLELGGKEMDWDEIEVFFSDSKDKRVNKIYKELISKYPEYKEKYVDGPNNIIPGEEYYFEEPVKEDILYALEQHPELSDDRIVELCAVRPDEGEGVYSRKEAVICGLIDEDSPRLTLGDVKRIVEESINKSDYQARYDYITAEIDKIQPYPDKVYGSGMSFIEYCLDGDTQKEKIVVCMSEIIYTKLNDKGDVVISEEIEEIIDSLPEAG